MSSEAQSILDAVIAISRTVSREQSIREKEWQIARASAPMCGNCSLWMDRRRCKPESRGEMRTMCQPACLDFQLSNAAKRLCREFTAELVSLSAPEG